MRLVTRNQELIAWSRDQRKVEASKIAAWRAIGKQKVAEIALGELDVAV